MKLGVHVSSFTWPGGPQRLAQNLTRVARAAEDNGFDKLTVMDHLSGVPPGTALARTCWTSWRISDGVGSSMRRLPHCSVTRFQYDPYARRQPSPTRADTTGMYSAKAGAGGLAAGAASERNYTQLLPSYDR